MGSYFKFFWSYQIIASFLLHWIGQSLLLLLHFPLNIIIWEDHKLFQINQSQPSYSSFYYTVNLFFLTRVFCVNIHCQELEFVGIYYYWENLKVVIQQRANHRHHMLLFLSEIIDINYQLLNQRIVSLLGGSIVFLLSYPFRLHIAFVTGSNKFFDLCESARGEYI